MRKEEGDGRTDRKRRRERFSSNAKEISRYVWTHASQRGRDRERKKVDERGRESKKIERR